MASTDAVGNAASATGRLYADTITSVTITNIPTTGDDTVNVQELTDGLCGRAQPSCARR
ncbi:hypothetical protein [Salipiger aestuarii]|uniref:hypothetical protein n=1 Tax=Salipiger aestuarii TaxID=568098 RepID=UPI0014728BF8|nr:hypothetical protein [Salipiger aestuarii]